GALLHRRGSQPRRPPRGRTRRLRTCGDAGSGELARAEGHRHRARPPGPFAGSRRVVPKGSRGPAPVTTRGAIAARRRRGRTLAAALILVAWVGGLAALIARDFFRERAAIIAEAAMRLGPSATYFVVEQDGRQIGFASTTIDTTGTSFQVVDYFIADLPVAGREIRASARSAITLSRALALRRFDIEMDLPETPMSAAGSVEGDSAVAFVLRMPGQASDTQRVAVRGPILVPTVLPAVAMLVGEPKVGNTVTLPDRKSTRLNS